jgi:hypothetical protein
VKTNPLFLACLFAFVASPGEAQTAQAGLPAIVPTDVYVDPVPAWPIYWIDDDRIVLRGYTNQAEARRDKPRHFVVFDTGTRRAEDRGVIGGCLCASRDYVRYFTAASPSSGPSRWIGGPPGHERAIEKPMPPWAEGKIHFNDWECNWEIDPPPLPPGRTEFRQGDRWLMRLRPDHGFLEFNVEGVQRYPLQLVPPVGSGRPVVDLPALKDYQMFGLPERFYPHQGAYLIRGMPPGNNDRRSQAETLMHYWWLYPDGRLERSATFRHPKDDSQPSEIDLAKGGTIRVPVRINDATPFSQGYLINGGTYSFRDELGKLGLYYADLQIQVKLLPGVLTNIFVSPNGCRAAVGVDDKDPIRPPERYRLYVIDACVGAKSLP